MTQPHEEAEHLAKGISNANMFKMYGTQSEIMRLMRGRIIEGDSAIIIDQKFTLGQIALLFLALTASLSQLEYSHQIIIDQAPFDLWMLLRSVLIAHQDKRVGGAAA